MQFFISIWVAFYLLNYFFLFILLKENLFNYLKILRKLFYCFFHSFFKFLFYRKKNFKENEFFYFLMIEYKNVFFKIFFMNLF